MPRIVNIKWLLSLVNTKFPLLTPQTHSESSKVIVTSLSRLANDILARLRTDPLANVMEPLASEVKLR